MKNFFKGKKIITALLIVMLLIALTFSLTAFAEESGAGTKGNPLNPIYWLIGVGVLIVIVVVINLITYYMRTGMYGDVKKDEKKEEKNGVTISKEESEGKKPTQKKKAKTKHKKKESFLDSDVKTIMAGNRTIEIDKETCLMNNKKK